MKTATFEGFCGPTYSGVSLTPVFDAERAINLFPEPGYKTSKSKMALIGRPGLSPTPFITLANTPVRSLWAGNNRLFAVGGTHFYEISAAGAIITDYGAMAGSAGTGYASAIANGTQLLVYDSSAAKIFEAGAGVMNLRFNGVALEYLDGFYLSIATGASLAGANPNQINCSALDDGTSWPALNFVLRRGSSDLTNGLAVLNSQLWIFGQKTIEVWYNAGNPNFPFARIQGATINLGLIAPASIVKFYNCLIWLGADDRGYPQVYMAQGLNPVRISNFAIENLIAGVSASTPGGNSAVLNYAWAYGYQESGHTFYVLTIVSASFLPLNTYVYDLTTGLWHERLYAPAAPWPISFASIPGSGFNATGPNFVGDARSGKIHWQGMGYANDGGTAITYSRTAPHISDRNNWVKYPSLEIDADVGTAQMTLSYSNDGGRNFLTLARPDATISGSASVAFKRYKWWQLGRSRDRVFKISITDSTNLIRIVDANLGIGIGEEP